MDKKHGPISAEDYAEPRCLLCGEPYGSAPEIKPVPQQRIAAKLDEYMAKETTPARNVTWITGRPKQNWAGISAASS